MSAVQMETGFCSAGDICDCRYSWVALFNNLFLRAEILRARRNLASTLTESAWKLTASCTLKKVKQVIMLYCWTVLSMKFLYLKFPSVCLMLGLPNSLHSLELFVSRLSWVYSFVRIQVWRGAINPCWMLCYWGSFQNLSILLPIW